MMFRQSVQESTVRSAGILSICFLATVCLFLVSSCGGGGGGGSSSPAPTPTPGTLFTANRSDSITLAKVNGTKIEGHTVHIIDQEVYSATATLNSDNTFAMNFSLYPGGGTTVFSATGSINVSGNSITATVTEPGQPSFQITLNKTTSSLAGGYYGSYSGTSSGTFVAGIDGSGNSKGFDGNDIDGWSSFSTTLSGSSFSATQSDGSRFSGSCSGTAVSGNWVNNNSVPAESGTFNGPKVF